jgi:NDP-sugar pyrophosphorylase family protein
MQIVVLAGGLATRMRPETEQTPKSLLPVNGRPFVDWQLDRFVASGARSVVMCVGYLGEQIEAHVRRALDRGLVVSYSYDVWRASWSSPMATATCHSTTRRLWPICGLTRKPTPL